MNRTILKCFNAWSTYLAIHWLVFLSFLIAVWLSTAPFTHPQKVLLRQCISKAPITLSLQETGALIILLCYILWSEDKVFLNCSIKPRQGGILQFQGIIYLKLFWVGVFYSFSRNYHSSKNRMSFSSEIQLNWYSTFWWYLTQIKIHALLSIIYQAKHWSDFSSNTWALHMWHDKTVLVNFPFHCYTTASFLF